MCGGGPRQERTPSSWVSLTHVSVSCSWSATGQPELCVAFHLWGSRGACCADPGSGVWGVPAVLGRVCDVSGTPSQCCGPASSLEVPSSFSGMWGAVMCWGVHRRIPCVAVLTASHLSVASACRQGRLGGREGRTYPTVSGVFLRRGGGTDVHEGRPRADDTPSARPGEGPGRNDPAETAITDFQPLER